MIPAKIGSENKFRYVLRMFKHIILMFFTCLIQSLKAHINISKHTDILFFENFSSTNIFLATLISMCHGAWSLRGCLCSCFFLLVFGHYQCFGQNDLSVQRIDAALMDYQPSGMIQSFAYSI